MRRARKKPTETESKQVALAKRHKDRAYEERNRVVAMAAKMALRLGYRAGKKSTPIEGWNPEWFGCVYIDLPSGQASWHYHESMEKLFSDLPEYDGEWDGHDTKEKYNRVSNYGKEMVQHAENPDS